jgi:hypothetical protein
MLSRGQKSRKRVSTLRTLAPIPTLNVPCAVWFPAARRPRAPKKSPATDGGWVSTPQRKGARRSERPSQSCSRCGLQLFFANLQSVIPRAARLVTASFVGCLRHISGERWASEGKCQSQRERRNEQFHGLSPLVAGGYHKNTGWPRRVPQLEAHCLTPTSVSLLLFILRQQA